jgi:hypothetical protein
MGALNRQDVPPKPGPAMEIFRVSAGTNFKGTILSESLWGVWTHWDGYRTRECTAKFVYDDGGENAGQVESIRDQGIRLLDHPTGDTECRGHIARWPLRWKAYLYVFNQGLRKCGFIELTPLAGQEILRQAPASKNLRGLHLTVGRSGNGNKTKCWVELTKGVISEAELPKPQDPEDTLRCLWGWPSKR